MPHSCKIGLTGLVLAALLPLWPRAAQAQVDPRASQRVAIVRMEFEGNVPEAVRELLVDRLVEGLAAAKFEVYEGRAVSDRLRNDAALAGCRDSSCYPRMAEALKVGYLVAGKVVENGKTYSLGLEIINGRTGGIVANNRERCETCGIEEVGEKMALAASALRARLETLTREPARFVIRSRPAGAVVTVDGAQVGRTPLDVELAGGEHRLSLSLAGYEPLERRFTAVSAVDETMDLDLIPTPTTFPYKAAGWSGIAAGVVAVVAGVWTMSLDGKNVSCDNPDRRGNCPKIYSTKAGGAVLIGLGAAAASLGGVLLYIDGSRPRAPGDEARLSLGVGGRF
jgi:TolB-like protein